MRTCVYISRDRKRGRDGAGGVCPPHQYIPNHDPKRAKPPCKWLGRNRDFCIVTPLKKRSKRVLDGPKWDHFCSITSFKQLPYISNRLLTCVAHEKGICAPPPRVRVTKPSSNDPGVVSKPRYISKQLAYKRAKALLTCVAHYRERKGRASPGASRGSRAFPKRKARSIPSIRAVSWHARFSSGRKSSISRSILVRLRARLAGSTASDVLQGLVFFIYFISHIFMYMLF